MKNILSFFKKVFYLLKSFIDLHIETSNKMEIKTYDHDIIQEVEYDQDRGTCDVEMWFSFKEKEKEYEVHVQGEIEYKYERDDGDYWTAPHDIIEIVDVILSYYKIFHDTEEVHVATLPIGEKFLKDMLEIYCS